MSYYLFLSILFILLLHHCGCGGATVQEAQMMTTTVVGSSVHTATTTQDGLEKCTFNGLTYPFLVATDDVIAVTGAANCSDNSNGNIDIVAKYIEIGGDEKSGSDDWIAGLFKPNNNEVKWKTEFAVRHEEEDKRILFWVFAAAATKNKIYIVMDNYTAMERNNLGGFSQRKNNLNIKLVVGTVSGGKDSRTITWRVEDFFDAFKTEELKQQLKNTEFFMSPFYFFPIMTEKKDILFVTELVRVNNEKFLYVLVHLNDTENTKTTFETSYLEVNEHCFPNFFPWRENKIIMFAHCKHGRNYMSESSNLGKTWVNTTRSLLRLHSFFEQKQGFTLANIENKTVLLFFQQHFLPSISNGNNKNDIIFWGTDGNRVHAFRFKSTDGSIFFLMNLLYIHGELLSLQLQRRNKMFEDVALTHFNSELANMKSVLKAWENTDNFIVSACERAAMSKSFCTPDIIDGLVGFLSNNSDGNNEWADEYTYVNATVTKGEKVNDGFVFSGSAAGAKWPVGKSKEDQSYNFTDFGFTLVTRVNIEGSAEKGEHSSLLGVGYNGYGHAKKTVGLWCTKDNKWSVTIGEESTKQETQEECMQDKMYTVALVLKDDQRLFIYVDGEQLTGLDNDRMKIEKIDNITHFYFGVDTEGESQLNTIESHVMITNVLLYNRPLAQKEIEKIRIILQEKPQEDDNNSIDYNSSKEKTQGDRETTGGSSGGNGDNSNTTDKDTKITDMTSPSQPESSTLCEGVGCVFLTLLFLLFGLCVHTCTVVNE